MDNRVTMAALSSLSIRPYLPVLLPVLLAHGNCQPRQIAAGVRAGLTCAMMADDRLPLPSRLAHWTELLESALTINPLPSPARRDTFVVMRLVEYEPPPRDIQQCRPLSHVLQHRTPQAPRRRSGSQPAVSKAAAVSPPAPSPPMRQAAIFADAALRRVLEVIDRRRPAAALRSLLTPSLVDSVLSVGRAVAECDGAAVLRRARLQAVVREGPHTAAEVFGTYSRGQRIHAIACRVEQVPAIDGTRWLVVALHIG